MAQQQKIPEVDVSDLIPEVDVSDLIETPIGDVKAKPENLAQEMMINKPASLFGRAIDWATTGVLPPNPDNDLTADVQNFFNPSPLDIGLAATGIGAVGVLGSKLLRKGAPKITGALERLEKMPLSASGVIESKPNPAKPLREYMGGFNLDKGPFKSKNAPITPSMGDYDEPIDILTGRIRSGIPPLDDNSLKEALRSDGLLINLASAAKGSRATGDLGPVFRQGIAYAGRPAWFKALKQQFVSYASEGGHLKYLENLKKDKLIQSKWAEKMGLDITDTVKAQEEAMMGMNIIEKVPGIGRFAKASNRAFTDSMNELRLGIANTLYDNYDKLYNSMKKTAKTAKELEEAEFFNPNNPAVGRKIADSVNTGSGRGSLKVGNERLGEINAEPFAKELNLFFFSPRLVSSRLRTINRTLNPVSYMQADPVMRRENLKQLLSIAAAVTTGSTLYEMTGAKTGTDPTSSDFGKSRFGNITIDNTGGFGRYGTLAARLATQTTTSGRTGKTFKLGENPVVGDALGVVENFGEGLASPVASMAMDLIRGKDFVGKKLDFKNPNPFENTAVKDLMMPMIYQDLYDIMKEDPSYIPLIFPAALGQSVNVFSSK